MKKTARKASARKASARNAVSVSMADGSAYVIAHGLLSSKNAKIEKTNELDEYYVTGLSLAPAHTSGFEVCKGASDGCRKACLFTAGQGRFENVQTARIAKTRLFFQDRATFKRMLFDDIRKAQRTARKRGLPLAIRLNVLSDLPWERIFPDLFDAFPDVQFYDYTKVAGRQTPSNYHLTFSRSESNQAQAERELAAGRNVTVVFRSKVLPLKWLGAPVVSGDSSDLRFKDPSGHVIGLYAKGRALTDASGFVVDTAIGCGAN